LVLSAIDARAITDCDEYTPYHSCVTAHLNLTNKESEARNAPQMRIVYKRQNL